MQLNWTSKALSDLSRLYEFLEPVNLQAAAETLQSLTLAGYCLLDNPRIGIKLHEFEPRAICSTIIKNWEMRYQIYNNVIYILLFWHSRENR